MVVQERYSISGKDEEELDTAYMWSGVDSCLMEKVSVKQKSCILFLNYLFKQQSYCSLDAEGIGESHLGESGKGLNVDCIGCLKRGGEGAVSLRLRVNGRPMCGRCLSELCNRELDHWAFLYLSENISKNWIIKSQKLGIRGGVWKGDWEGKIIVFTTEGLHFLTLDGEGGSMFYFIPGFRSGERICLLSRRLVWQRSLMKCLVKSSMQLNAGNLGRRSRPSVCTANPYQINPSPTIIALPMPFIISHLDYSADTSLTQTPGMPVIGLISPDLYWSECRHPPTHLFLFPFPEGLTAKTIPHECRHHGCIWPAP